MEMEDETNEENDKQLLKDECAYTNVLPGTVLGEAVSYASYNLVSRLISKGADPHAFQRWHGGNSFAIEKAEKTTPLHIAALYGNAEAIKALFEHRLPGKIQIGCLSSMMRDESRYIGPWQELTWIQSTLIRSRRGW